MLTLDDGEPPKTIPALCPLSLTPILDRCDRFIPGSTWSLICVIVLQLGEQQTELIPFRVSEHCHPSSPLCPRRRGHENSRDSAAGRRARVTLRWRGSRPRGDRSRAPTLLYVLQHRS